MCHPVVDAWVILKQNPISRFNSIPIMFSLMAIIALFQLSVSTTASYIWPTITLTSVVSTWGAWLVVLMICGSFIIHSIISMDRTRAEAIRCAKELLAVSAVEEAAATREAIVRVDVQDTRPTPAAAPSQPQQRQTPPPPSSSQPQAQNAATVATSRRVRSRSRKRQHPTTKQPLPPPLPTPRNSVSLRDAMPPRSVTAKT